jgi:hypothetical protein
MLRPSDSTFQSPDASTLARVGRCVPSPFRRAVIGARGLDQTTLDVQIVLVTRDGLELPLVESPGQAVRLLEVVSEMAADTDRERPRRNLSTAERRPRAVRIEQVFDRVRVVVRRDRSTEGGDAA